MKLDTFDNSDFDRGRSRWVELAWLAISGLTVSTWIPGSAWRRALLSAFGAQIAEGVVIKSRVRVKFPWRLSVGAHSWLGEGAWIDNLAPVTIGTHCCVSQGAYLCTGNHRWDTDSFDLEARPIVIEDQCWVGARSIVTAGVRLHRGCVLCAGGVASRDLEPDTIYRGDPAKRVRQRLRSAQSE